MTYHIRLHNLQKSIKQSSVDALLVDHKIDLMYLTGLELSAGQLLIHAKGATLFVDSRYFELCSKNSPFPVELIKDPNPLNILANLEFPAFKKIGFDSETTSYMNYEKLRKGLEGKGIQLVPIDSPIKWQRMIKDEAEINLLKEAAALGSQGFDFLCSLLKEGLTEEECSLELDIFWKRKGSKTVAFDPIIAFGPNSSMPHYRAGKVPLKKGQIALLDIGVNIKNYHSDMTRVVFFGEPDARLLAVHAIVQKAQAKSVALCRPGVLIGSIDSAARELIASYGHAEHFTHNLGHGVGLEIHEYPTIKNGPPFAQMELKPGMVITIEPGIYLPNIGGVRIEDTIVITEDGHENLTMRSTDPVFISC